MEKEIRVLVTGAKGFIGKNICAELVNRKIAFYACDTDTSGKTLDAFCRDCTFVFHFAGVNRPQDPSEFMLGNYGFTTKLVENLKKHGNKSPILMTSSIQAEKDNEYGKSKKAGEAYLLEYGKAENVKVFVYRLPNVFGKWSRPNYNSAVATFCNNLSRNLPITVTDRATVVDLVYIDDVMEEFIGLLRQAPLLSSGYCNSPIHYNISLGELTDILESFKNSRTNLKIPFLSDPLTKKLYSTYLSFLPEDGFAYELKMNTDERGSFTEMLKSESGGQVSVNVSKSGITKGNHWHHTKNEKFLVVKGEGIIRFRKIGEQRVIEYAVDGNNLTVVDIPCGYTHNIENVGENDMVTVMWANEPFDANKPDTFFEKV